MKERVSPVVMPALPSIAPGDPYPLLRATINLLDEDDLQSVARADYGNDSGEHFARLADVVRLCELPTPLKWHPREVLELTRWSEASAEDPDTVARIHRQRAFACTVLLVSYGDPNNVDASYGSNQTLIKLLDSLETLGTEVEDDALSLLSWLIPRLPDHEAGEVPFFGLAMLWFALGRLAQQDDAALLGLCEWIISAEEVVRRRQSTGGRLAGSWLLSGTGYDTHLDAWRRLGRRLVDRLDTRHGPEVKEAVLLIGAMLT
ncbi:hypothetical protein G6L46_08680 [Agrobacterium rhizogenes]|nr:hypothetical protein [Rhizobium rhizogenes]